MKLFGKFELHERIGAGGMGEVFRATFGPRSEAPFNAAFDVAVKRILPHLASDPRFLDLFLAEVKVTAQLNHPNIVSIFSFGEEEGVWSVVMEYVRGVDLRALAPLAPGLVALVGSQAAAALDCAHKARDQQGRARKIVHRDVSPHNVLVSATGEVKLIDFGVARAVEGLPGKAAYFAPEVAEGGAASPASDQFSLGVVLWELLSGKRLFKGPSDAVTLQRAAACQVPAPAAGPPLDEVVMRALSREPSARFPDCAALKQALDDVLMELDEPCDAAALGAAVTAARKP